MGPDTVEALRQVMIRHTKTMQIGNEAALALPNASVETVFLDMSEREVNLSETFKCSMNTPSSLKNASSLSALDMRFHQERAAASNVYTAATTFYTDAKVKIKASSISFASSIPFVHRKTRADIESMCSWIPGVFVKRPIHHMNQQLPQNAYFSSADKGCTKLRALCEDVFQLYQTDSAMRVIVFTQHLVALYSIVRMFQEDSRFLAVEVRMVEGDMPISARNNAIDAFQRTDRMPRILVMTTRTGAVGINLQAAYRVYLFEPSFDPAVEAQALGRIHRLGQTKDVTVKRFAFRNTIDERICKLHEAMKTTPFPMGRLPRWAAELLAN